MTSHQSKPTFMQSFRNASGVFVMLVLLGLGWLAYHGLLIPLVLGVLVIALLAIRGRRKADGARVPED